MTQHPFVVFNVKKCERKTPKVFKWKRRIFEVVFIKCNSQIPGMASEEHSKLYAILLVSPCGQMNFSSTSIQSPRIVDD
ncbi:hypothetical protein TNIN_493971 [Trichonephila inaurata madagascariensis]|uniref:Uncharacterized protein n=1 Tax=Trichonephila inaurata madagascariensis TaxID=2747483 RepID=A0A8X6X8F3_9ARAC|nr:hypothetical protein TNIN_493971 [Trichonephila inaurata madagascariensis]